VEPRLYFLHLLLPHQPWTRLPGGLSYEAPAPPPGLSFLIWDDPASAERARQQHLLQLERTDELLGEVLDSLDASGLWDEALIVVTADHGVSFIPGAPARGMSRGNQHNILLTPLFVKLPGQQQASRSDLPVSGLDVLPTIIDVLGIETDLALAGASLAEPDDGHPVQRSVLDWRFNNDEFEVIDGFIPIDRDALLEALLTSAASTPQVGGRADPLALYRIGPRPGLIGREVRDLRIGSGAAVTLSLSAPADGDAHLDTPEGDVEAFVHGSTSAAVEAPVAIVVNGRVALVAETRSSSRGPGELWGLIPPTLLEDGPNAISAYVVEGPAAGGPDAVVLHEVEVVAERP
jgi:hypothetical protein